MNQVLYKSEKKSIDSERKNSISSELNNLFLHCCIIMKIYKLKSKDFVLYITQVPKLYLCHLLI